MKRISIIGNKYGKLTVIEDSGERRNGAIMYICECACGGDTLAMSGNLKRGEIRSCGCIGRGLGVKDVPTCSPEIQLTRIRYGMIQRCTQVSHRSYKWYGGKAVAVCNEWTLSKEAFIKWSLENGYKLGLTIERISSAGDYCPLNCKWITQEEQ